MLHIRTSAPFSLFNNSLVSQSGYKYEIASKRRSVSCQLDLFSAPALSGLLLLQTSLSFPVTSHPINCALNQRRHFSPVVQLTSSCGSVAPFGRPVPKHSDMFLKRKPLISRYALHLAFSESQPHICVSCHIERDAPDGWARGSQKHRACFLFWTWVLLNSFVKCNVLWVIESCTLFWFEEEQVLNKVGCQQGHS